MAEFVRLDKYLWAVRLYKTRAEAAEACKASRVKINELEAKPSKMIRIGDKISLRKAPVLYSYKVLNLLERRVGAQLVPEYLQDLTPQSELDKLNMPNEFVFLKRDRGGRPTKKERRELDKILIS